jgi:hypothetical protein
MPLRLHFVIAIGKRKSQIAGGRFKGQAPESINPNILRIKS